MKKSLSAALVAALVITAPGPLATRAAAQVLAGGSKVAPVSMPLGSAPDMNSGTPTFNLVTLAMLGVPTQLPSVMPTPRVTPVGKTPAALARPIAASGNAAALATFAQPAAARSADAATLDQIFDNGTSAASAEDSSVLASPAAAAAPLSAAGTGPAAQSPNGMAVARTFEVLYGPNNTPVKVEATLPPPFLFPALQASAKTAVVATLTEFLANRDDISSVTGVQVEYLHTIEIVGGIDVFEVRVHSNTSGDSIFNVEVSGHDGSVQVSKSVKKDAANGGYVKNGFFTALANAVKSSWNAMPAIAGFSREERLHTALSVNGRKLSGVVSFIEEYKSQGRHRDPLLLVAEQDLLDLKEERTLLNSELAEIERQVAQRQMASALGRQARRDGANGGSLATVGLIAGAALLAGYVFSPTLRATVKRYWNIALGRLGLGAKKMETPEVMAERLTQQLNEEEARYDVIVEEAATEVARIQGSIEALNKQAAELQGDVDAVITDSDDANNGAAAVPQRKLDVVKQSIATAEASLKAAQASFEDARQERSRFDATKAGKIAELQARLSDVERARFDSKLAELKKQNTSGDRQKTEDRFERAAQDEIAKGKGAKTAVDTDPNEIVRKARAAADERAAREAIEKRKEELKGKKDGVNGGNITPQMTVPPVLISLFTGLIGYIIAGLSGFTVASAAAIGLTVATFALPLTMVCFLLKDILKTDKNKKDGANGGSVAVVGLIAGAALLAGYVFSPTLRATVKRYWNVALGRLGLGAKRMETPEVMAERLTQQLNEEEKRYDVIVEQAATEVARIQGSIEALHKQAAELQKDVDGVITDSDPANDDAAATPQRKLDVVKLSIATAEASLKAAQASFEDARQERSRFDATKAGKIAELQARLSDVERARFDSKLAELKKQNTSGDRQKTEDSFERAAQEEIAKGKGAKTAVDTDPNEIVRKARAAADERAAREAIEKRKEELKGKKDGINGGEVKPVGRGPVEIAIAVIEGIVRFPLKVVVRTVQFISERTGFSPAKTSLTVGVLGLATTFGLILRGGMPIFIMLPLVLESGLFVAYSEGLHDNEISRKESDKLSATVNRHRSELMAIRGVVAVTAKATANDRYILVEVTTLDAENLAQLSKSIKGYRIVTRIVPVLQNARNSGSAALGLIAAIAAAAMVAATLVTITVMAGGWVSWQVFGMPERARLARMRNQLPAVPGVTGVKIRYRLTNPWSGGYVALAEVAPGADLKTVGAALRSWETILGLNVKMSQNGKTYRLPPHEWSESKKDGANGGSLATVGLIAGAALLAGYVFSPTLRATVKRYWNVALGRLGLGAKRMETPEVMAERLTQQLNEEEKRYDVIVEQAATEVARIQGSIEALHKQAAELQKDVDGVITDSDPANDDAAATPQRKLDVVKLSIATAEASLKAAQASFEDARQERSRFDATKAGKIAELQARLSDVERARFDSKLAELKKQNTSGDRQKTEDSFERAAQEEIAKGKGAKTAVDTDPNEIVRKARAAADERAAREAIEKRKEELKGKKDGANGGYMDARSAKIFVGAVGVGVSLLAPFLGSAAVVLIGLIAMAALSAAHQKTAARTLFAVGGITALIGALPLVTGLTFGTVFGAGFRAFSFIVPSGMAMVMGVLLYRSAGKTAPAPAAPTTAPAPTPAPVAVVEPVAAPVKGPTVGDRVRDAANATGEIVTKAGAVVANAAEVAAAAATEAVTAALEAVNMAGAAANAALNQIADKLETPEVKLEMYSQALDEQERLMDEAIAAASLEIGRLQAEMESPAFRETPADIAAQFDKYLQESMTALREAQTARASFRTGRALKIAEARRAFARSKKDGANGGFVGEGPATALLVMFIFAGLMGAIPGTFVLITLSTIMAIIGLTAIGIGVTHREAIVEGLLYGVIATGVGVAGLLIAREAVLAGVLP